MAVEPLAVEVRELSRRVGRIEDTNPAVTASRVEDLTGDVVELKSVVADLQSTIVRSTITLCVALAGTSATIWAVFR